MSDLPRCRPEVVFEPQRLQAALTSGAALRPSSYWRPRIAGARGNLVNHRGGFPLEHTNRDNGTNTKTHHNKSACNFQIPVEDSDVDWAFPHPCRGVEGAARDLVGQAKPLRDSHPSRGYLKRKLLKSCYVRRINPPARNATLLLLSKSPSTSPGQERREGFSFRERTSGPIPYRSPVKTQIERCYCNLSLYLGGDVLFVSLRTRAKPGTRTPVQPNP